MFNYLRNEGNKLEENKIRQSHPDIFSVFEKGFLDSNTEQELLECIIGINDNDFTKIKDNLARLRRLQEQIYIGLNRKDKRLVPDMYMEPFVMVSDIYKHLSEINEVNRYSVIGHFAAKVYNVTSAGGSHTPYDGPENEIFYKPTKYTVQAITFASMDLLLWFKNVMES